MDNTTTTKEKISYLSAHILPYKKFLKRLEGEGLPGEAAVLFKYTAKTIENGYENKILIDFAYDILAIIFDDERKHIERLREVSEKDKEAIRAIMKDKHNVQFIKERNDFNKEQYDAVFVAAHCAMNNLPFNRDNLLKIDAVLHSATLPANCIYETESLTRFSETAILLRECKLALARAKAKDPRQLSKENNQDELSDSARRKQGAYQTKSYTFEELFANEPMGQASVKKSSEPLKKEPILSRKVFLFGVVSLSFLALYFLYPYIASYITPAPDDSDTAKRSEKAIKHTTKVVNTASRSTDETVGEAASRFSAEPPTLDKLFRTLPALLSLAAIENETGLSERITLPDECPLGLEFLRWSSFTSEEGLCVQDTTVFPLWHKEVTPDGDLEIIRYKYTFTDGVMQLYNTEHHTFTDE